MTSIKDLDAGPESYQVAMFIPALADDVIEGGTPTWTKISSAEAFTCHDYDGPSNNPFLLYTEPDNATYV